MIKLKYLSIVTLFLLCFTTCIHRQVKPDMKAIIDEETFPKLVISNSININQILQGKGNTSHIIGPHYADLDDLTKCSVLLLKDILIKNNITIKTQGEKQLTLQVINVYGNRKLNNDLIVSIELKVSAGELINKKFKGTRILVEGWWITWAVEKAIADVVRKMLEDQDILKYLQEKL